MRKNQPFFIIALTIFCVILSLFFVFQDPLITVAAPQGPLLSILKGKTSTKERTLTLYLTGPENVKEMKISNEVDFPGAKWEPFQKQKEWTLDYGTGTKTVYAKFKDKKNKESNIVKDTILLDIPKDMDVDFTINKKAKDTNSRYVFLELTYSSGVETFAISNTKDFDLATEAFVQKEVPWILSSGSGEKTVFIRFKDANKKYITVSKKITYTQKEPFVEAGSVLVGQSDYIYYMGFDGRLHLFPSIHVFHSWYDSFEDVFFVSDQKIKEYQIGSPVCVRPGTWLLSFAGSSRVYAVEPGCQLRPLMSETEAGILYGSNWNERHLMVDTLESSFYTIVNSGPGAPAKQGTDKDADGLDADTEKEYGSSDSKRDTDADGLSDYEEILYWFTDPTKSDSDGDGVSDDIEASLGLSPLMMEEDGTLKEGTYTFPAGTVFYHSKKKQYYYRHSNGNDYALGSNKAAKSFIDAVPQSAFAAMPSFDMPVSKKILNLPGALEELRYPTIRVKNHTIPL